MRGQRKSILTGEQLIPAKYEKGTYSLFVEYISFPKLEVLQREFKVLRIEQNDMITPEGLRLILRPNQKKTKGH